MARRQFSLAEIEYLRTLPAVESVTESRITYARSFQVDCMRRYLHGERPSSIFIAVGLSPSVVGHKRVERNIARWKHDEQIMREAKRADETETGAEDVRDRVVEIHLGKIQSLTCRIMALTERVDKLEQMVAELRDNA